MEVPKTISYSRISLYKICPTAYLYRYVEHLKVPQPFWMFFGSFIHSWLTRFWNLNWKNPESYANAGIGYFKQWISGKLPNRKRKIIMDFKKIRSYENLAKKIFINFYLKNKNKKPIEIEKKHVVEWRGFNLEVKWDRIDEVKHNGNKLKIVIDYKLSSPERDKKLSLHQGLQFTFYSLAHEMIFKEKPILIWYHLKAGNVFATLRDEKHYEKLYEELKKFKSNLENNIFPPPNFDNPYCRFCEFSCICSERFPDAWKRKKTKRLEEKLDEIDFLTPEEFVQEHYSEQVPREIKEIIVGPHKYLIPINNKREFEKIEKILKLKSFSYWINEISVKKDQDKIFIESETQIPKNLKEKIQGEGLEIFEKIRSRILIF